MPDLPILTDGASALGVDLDERQIAQFQAYLDGLTAWNQRTNLTSPAALADAERVHLLDSLTLVPMIQRLRPDAESLVDVGSGAGLPAIPLKIAMPEFRVLMVEATGKKAEFISWAVTALELDATEVVARRAEEVGRAPQYRAAFDVATARAVGPLSVVMELTLPLLRVGGVLLAQRGPDAEREAIEAANSAQELGGAIAVEWVETAGGPRSGVVVVTKENDTPERYPRRVGIPTKRPLK